jgi:hypothetical protein
MRVQEIVKLKFRDKTIAATQEFGKLMGKYEGFEINTIASPARAGLCC